MVLLVLLTFIVVLNLFGLEQSMVLYSVTKYPDFVYDKTYGKINCLLFKLPFSKYCYFV